MRFSRWEHSLWHDDHTYAQIPTNTVIVLYLQLAVSFSLSLSPLKCQSSPLFKMVSFTSITENTEGFCKQTENHYSLHYYITITACGLFINKYMFLLQASFLNIRTKVVCVQFAAGTFSNCMPCESVLWKDPSPLFVIYIYVYIGVYLEGIGVFSSRY